MTSTNGYLPIVRVLTLHLTPLPIIVIAVISLQLNPDLPGPLIYRASILPPRLSFMCKSILIVPRFTVLLELPGLIDFPQEARKIGVLLY